MLWKIIICGNWKSAKKSKPLFPGHNQPRVPDHNNYYNLLDKETMEWQAKLARRAGIHGFCIYHYWFGEKQLLEKPAENLLKWKDIDINYCFSWANESWIRSWSKFAGNAWINSPKEAERNAAGMLIEQKYGDEEEWKRHFLYLLPFFQDERYIKKGNKSVFVIYIPSAIKCLKKMVDCWNKLAVENGFGGIYFVGLKDSSINVRYAIDKDADFLYTDVDVAVPTGILEPVDAIVVTAVYHFDEIKRMLRDKANCPIVFLEDIVFSL